MEKQSTRKFYRLLIAIVAFCVMCVSGLVLSSCKEHEHSYTGTITTQATCTTTGVETFTCSECGDTYTSVIPATGEHGTPNSYGACPDCGLIVDAEAFANALGTSGLASQIETLTGQLNTLATEVAGISDNVDAILESLTGAGEGATVGENVESLVESVQDVLTEIRNLIGSDTVEGQATPATIVGIASSIDTLQTTLNEIVSALEDVETVCDEHVWSAEPILTIAATCMKGGVEVYGCANCNAVYTIAIAPVVHVASEEPDAELSTPATCMADGKNVYTCIYGCGTVLSEEDVTATGHTASETPDAERSTAPTCTEAGENVYLCTVCGEVAKTEVAPATNHGGVTAPSSAEGAQNGSWVKSDAEGAYVAPTCTEAGSQLWVCGDCGATYTEEIAATGHVFTSGTTVWRYGTDIDFTVNTITATQYKVCDVCGAEVVDVDANGDPVTQEQTHIWAINEELTEAQSYIKLFTELTEEELAQTGLVADDAVYGYVNMSCTETGYVYWYCQDSNCLTNEAFPIEVAIDPLGHGVTAPSSEEGAENGLWVKATAEEGEEATYLAPTCTEAGYQDWVCSNCGETYREVLAALGHNYEGAEVTEVPATCTTDGYRDYNCVRCQAPVHEVIPALDHDLGEAVVTYRRIDNATHEVTTTYYCQREDCDYYEASSEIVAHTMTGTVDPDNVPNGYEIYEISDGVYVLTDAGCDRSGFIIDMCECGYCVRDWDSYVPLLGHDYSVITGVEGSCVTATMVTYSCSRCGVTYSTTLDMPDGHSWSYVNAVDATCDTAGNRAYAYCSTCGVVVEWDGTSTLGGFITTYVEGLNYLEDQDAVEAWAEIAALGHDFTETVSLIANGCEEPGWQITVCSVCGVDADGSLTLAANATGYTNPEEAIVAGVYEGASDEMLASLYGALNTALGLTDTENAIDSTADIEALLANVNFTGVTYLDMAGHSYTENQAAYNEDTSTWSEGTTPAVDCMADPLLDSKADYIAYAKALNSALTDEALGAKWTEAGYTDDSVPSIAYICETCGEIFTTVAHNVEYYMYVVTDAAGTTANAATAENPLDLNTAHVNTSAFVTDAEGDRISYTYAQIEEMGYTNENGTVNCYFLAYCTYGCNTNMGHSFNHTYPTSDNLDKYPNCMEGGYCVWCDEMILPPSNHNLQTLDTISAYSEEYAAAVDALLADETIAWALEDVEATCYEEGMAYNITVCVSCLMAWYEEDSRFIGWEQNVNYTTNPEEVATIAHTWEQHIVGINDETEGISNCLVGSYKYDTCYVCEQAGVTTFRLNDTVEAGDVLTYVASVVEETGAITTTTVTITAENAAEYTSNANGFYDIQEPTSHTVAPEENYWLNNNYQAPTATNPAYMNYICVECGAHVQGYYGEAETVAGIVEYTMATNEEIAAYLATKGSETLDKVAEWGNITYVRDEDKSATTTIAADAAATAVYDAVAAAETAGAAAAYVSLSADMTFSSTDGAYGFTFEAADSVKTVSIDLGGNTLTLTPAEARAAYSISGEGTIAFTNGTISAPANGQTNFAIHASLGAEIILDGVTMTSPAGIGSGNNDDPQAAMGDITIRNSVITSSGYYAVGTNASAWSESAFSLTIEDSKITQTAADGVAIMVNVPSVVNITNCTINGDRQGIIIRGGDIKANIVNTTINATGSLYDADNTDTPANAGATVNNTYFETNNWAGGNAIPFAGIVLGDKNLDYQVGETNVVLNNVTINANNGMPKIYVYADSSDTTLTITVTNASATAPTLTAADFVNGNASVEVGTENVYELTIDGTAVVPATEEGEGAGNESTGA